jgi:hypothetical protein
MIVLKTLLGFVLFSGIILTIMVICNFIGYGIRLIVERSDYIQPHLKEVGPNCVFGLCGSIIVGMVIFASYGIGINLF